MTERTQKLEETVAHLSRTVEDLSDILVRQQDEISQLKKRQGILMAREAEREAAQGGGVQLGDQRPPHW